MMIHFPQQLSLRIDFAALLLSKSYQQELCQSLHVKYACRAIGPLRHGLSIIWHRLLKSFHEVSRNMALQVCKVYKVENHAPSDSCCPLWKTWAFHLLTVINKYSKAHDFKDRWISSSSKSPKLQSNGGSIRRQQITMVTEVEKFKSVDY